MNMFNWMVFWSLFWGGLAALGEAVILLMGCSSLLYLLFAAFLLVVFVAF